MKLVSLYRKKMYKYRIAIRRAAGSNSDDSPLFIYVAEGCASPQIVAGDAIQVGMGWLAENMPEFAANFVFEKDEYD